MILVRGSPFGPMMAVRDEMHRLFHGTFRQVRGDGATGVTGINAKVLAVYKTSPLVLVVESAEGTVLELSLTDLHGAGHRLSDDACRSLVEDYQMFTCQPALG